MSIMETQSRWEAPGNKVNGKSELENPMLENYPREISKSWCYIECHSFFPTEVKVLKSLSHWEMRMLVGERSLDSQNPHAMKSHPVCPSLLFSGCIFLFMSIFVLLSQGLLRPLVNKTVRSYLSESFWQMRKIYQNPEKHFSCFC